MIRKLLSKVKKILFPCEKKTIDGFTMYLIPEFGGVSEVLSKIGNRELCFMKLLKTEVREGMLAYDIGANIGHTTLNIARGVGQSGKIIAIEPDPKNIGLLKKNVSANNFSTNCKIFEGAISDFDGYTNFFQGIAPNLSSLSPHNKVVSKIQVKVFDFQNFLKTNGYPNFIKMDVEGAEVKIFESGLNYFRENLGETHFLVEAHQFFYKKTKTSEKFSEILRNYIEIGFKPKFVISTPVATPTKFLEKNYIPVESIKTDGVERGIYNNISVDDFLDFTCNEHNEGKSTRILRSFMLSREIS